MKKVLFCLIVIAIGFKGISQVIYDQSTVGIDVVGSISNYFTNKDTAIISADDFVILSGDSWEITSITINGFRNNGGPSIDSMQLNIYSDLNGVPGSIIYSSINTVSIPSPVSDIAVDLALNATLNLTEGTYWVSAIGFAPDTCSWRWLTTEGDFNASPYLIDSDNYLKVGLTDWSSFSSIGINNKGLRFKVHGKRFFANIENSNIKDLELFPNPVNDILTIKNIDQEIKSVSIYSMNGKLIKGFEFNNKIDLSDLATGSYLIELETKTTSLRQRFVKL